MKEIIRQILADEVESSLKLSEFAFQYALSPEERQERIANYKPDQHWGFFVEDKLASKMSVLPFHIWLNDRSIAMGGIASVATWPEYRRSGMVHKMLLHALADHEGAWTNAVYAFSV